MDRREPSEPGYDPTDDESDVETHFKAALDARGKRIDEEEKKGNPRVGWENPRDEYGFASRGHATPNTASEARGRPGAFQSEEHHAPEGQRPSIRSRLRRALNRLLRRPT